MDQKDQIIDEQFQKCTKGVQKALDAVDLTKVGDAVDHAFRAVDLTKIGSAVDRALSSVDMSKIGSAMDTAIGNLKNFLDFKLHVPSNKKTVIQVQYPSRVAPAVLATIGVIGFAGFGLAALILGIIGMSMNVPPQWLQITGIVMAILTVGCFFVIRAAAVKLSQYTWLKKYIKAFGENTHSTIEELAQKAKRKAKLVERDLDKMIKSGYLPEGHLIKQEGTVIVSDATYEYYLQNKQEQEKQEEMRQQRAQDPKVVAAEAMLSEGRQQLLILQDFQNKLKNKKMCTALKELERHLEQIFAAVEKHPEQAGDLRRLMEYYLPTLTKMLHAYYEFENTGVDSSEVWEAKQDIEEALESIDDALENMLKQLFQDMAFDTSTDATVLQSMLARDGYADDGFMKEEK